MLVGVGITVFQEHNLGPVLIRELTAGGAAQRCEKIRVGDEVVSVDGINVRCTSTVTVRDLIIGDEGSKVLLGLCRPTASGPMMFSIELCRARTGNVVTTTTTTTTIINSSNNNNNNKDISELVIPAVTATTAAIATPIATPINVPPLSLSTIAAVKTMPQNGSPLYKDTADAAHTILASNQEQKEGDANDGGDDVSVEAPKLGLMLDEPALNRKNPVNRSSFESTFLETSDVSLPEPEITDKSYDKLVMMSTTLKEMRERFNAALTRQLRLTSELEQQKHEAEERIIALEKWISETGVHRQQQHLDKDTVNETILSQLEAEEKKRKVLEQQLAAATVKLRSYEEREILREAEALTIEERVAAGTRRIEHETEHKLETCKQENAILEEKLRHYQTMLLAETNARKDIAERERNLQKQLQEERRQWKETIDTLSSGQQLSLQVPEYNSGNSSNNNNMSNNNHNLSNSQLVMELQAERMRRKDAEAQAQRLLSELKRRVIAQQQLISQQTQPSIPPPPSPRKDTIATTATNPALSTPDNSSNNKKQLDASSSVVSSSPKLQLSLEILKKHAEATSSRKNN